MTVFHYHWCTRHIQLNSLALGLTNFISVAGSTIHASTCKGHSDRWLNGCRSRGQAYTGSINNNNNITHIPQNQPKQPSMCEEGVSECKKTCSKTENTSVQAADALGLLLTCVTFTRVKLHQRRPLWAGAGVSTWSEETEVAAHILTRVGY